MKRVKWSRRTTKFSNGQDGMVGRIKVFGINWAVLRHADGPWLLQCDLPGLEKYVSHHLDVECAESKAEILLGKWMQAVGMSWRAV